MDAPGSGLDRGGTAVSAVGPDLAVALDALESDAVRWTDAAVRLRTAAAAAAGQVLEPAAFSFAGGEVAAAYEGLRRRTATLLREGADNLDAVAAALRAGATSYAAVEAAAVQRLDTAIGGATAHRDDTAHRGHTVKDSDAAAGRKPANGDHTPHRDHTAHDRIPAHGDHTADGGSR